jgi:outer membrane protein assembly factor BamB
MKNLLSRSLVAALFLAAGCPRNHPPDEPSVPIGPAPGYPDSGYQITTVGHDPDGDGVAVRFSWGDGDTSAWSNLAASWSSFAGTHSWDSLGTYLVTAQARDEHADCSDWSGELEMAIVTANPPPDKPAVPTGQGDCIIGKEYIFTTSAADPNGDRLQFRFSWGDSDTTDWTELVPSGSQGSARHSWSNTGVFRVKSQARDEHGGPSDWSGELVVTVWDSTGGAPGTTKWEFAAEGGIASSPAIGADGTIYVGSYDHKLYAVSPDGMLKWEFLTGGLVKSSPAVGTDGTVYVGSDDSEVRAIDPDGTLKWTFDTRGAVVSSPAIGTDGTIYVGSRDGSLYAVYPDGTQKWEFITRGEVLSSPAVGTDGTIYVGSRDSCLYAIKLDGTK